MNDNYLSEKLNSIRNEMSHLWGAIFITGGGTIAIIAAATWDATKITLCLLGIFMTMLFINAYMVRKDNLMNTLKKLKKEEQ